MSITDSRLFWFVLAFGFAAVTIYSAKTSGNSLIGIWLFNTMLASANFGAKCVRAESANN